MVMSVKRCGLALLLINMKGIYSQVSLNFLASHGKYIVLYRPLNWAPSYTYFVIQATEVDSHVQGDKTASKFLKYEISTST